MPPSTGSDVSGQDIEAFAQAVSNKTLSCRHSDFVRVLKQGLENPDQGTINMT